ncbi:MAG TPA: hypothetical protein VGL08_08840 [Paraburkholderia sp.]|jgi:hypothetical protein
MEIVCKLKALAQTVGRIEERGLKGAARSTKLAASSVAREEDSEDGAS